MGILLAHNANGQSTTGSETCYFPSILPNPEQFKDTLSEKIPESDSDEPYTNIIGNHLKSDRNATSLIGDVVMLHGNQFLGAERLFLDKKSNDYIADEGVFYQGSGIRITADHARGNQQTRNHHFEDIQYQLVIRNGSGYAKSITITDGTQGVLLDTTYSTCPPNQKYDWKLQAREIRFDTESGRGTAYDTKLKIGNIPVLYIPWFPFPIDDRRRTGLLYPSIGSSGRDGFQYTQPFYLNLAPNYDMTLATELLSKRGTVLDTNFRYFTHSGTGILNTQWIQYDRLRDRERGQFNFTGTHNLPKYWQARAKLNWISDTNYLEDFSSDISTVIPYSLNSTLGIYGRGLSWDAGAETRQYQLADPILTDAILPYNTLPRTWLNWEQPLHHWLQAGLHAEVVRFTHTLQRDGDRIDIKPYVSAPFQQAAWFITPSLAWRYTAYTLEDSTIPEENTPSNKMYRSLPITSLNAGLFYDREVIFGDQNYLQTIQPHLFYLRVPYRDQSTLPLFDTRILTFSWGQLFRENRYTGADRQADADQITLALSTQFLRKNDGHEKFSAGIGQIYYLEESTVTLPSELPVEKGPSSWISNVNYTINDNWNIGISYQWNSSNQRRELSTLHTQYLFDNHGVINFNYRFRIGLLEQTDFSFVYPLNPTLDLISRYYYSVRDHRILEGIVGVQWKNCCMTARIIGTRHLQSSQGELDNSIRFELEFKGLGSAGSNVSEQLGRAILGYHRDDLYIIHPSNASSENDANSLDPVL